MTKKTIDTICWWIPFKKTRHAVRYYLTINSKNDDVDNVTTTIPPPSEYKYLQLIRYGLKYNIKTCIETGTLFGDAAATCKDYFDKFYTIELSEDLFNKASERFKDTPKVITLQGDSTHVLPKILSDIKEKCLFWLDGHYSGGITAQGEKDTPIMEELEFIFNHGDYSHVILIDDARCFGDSELYPSYPTLEKLEEYVKSKRPNCSYEVFNDIIRIVL